MFDATFFVAVSFLIFFVNAYSNCDTGGMDVKS